MSVTRFLGFLDISPHLFNPPAAEGMQGAGRPGGPDSALISLLPPPAKGRQATVHQVSDLHFLFFSITPTVWVHAKSLQSCPTLCNPMDYIVRQAPLSMGFSRQESWSVLPFPPAGDLPHPGIEPPSLMSPALAGGFFTTSTTREASHCQVRETERSEVPLARKWGSQVPG